jgi:hypothetical protein
VTHMHNIAKARKMRKFASKSNYCTYIHKKACTGEGLVVEFLPQWLASVQQLQAFWHLESLQKLAGTSSLNGSGHRKIRLQELQEGKKYAPPSVPLSGSASLP